MHEPLDRLESIAAIARHDQPPRTRVAESVLIELRAQAEAEEQPMILFAAGSAALAAACALAGFIAFDTITDPLALLFHTTPVLG